MENSGRFKIGHKETDEIKKKRSESLTSQWKQRDAYHGFTGTKIYNNWRSMVTRCNGTCGKDSIKKYKNKGITVCERWKLFANFYEDMHKTHFIGATIDRIDNSKGYFIENCRWATTSQQANNKTNNVKVKYNGTEMTLTELQKHSNRSLNGLRLMYHRKFAKGLITLDRLLQK
tara:strand:+ start:335 stop:856 length:522 start_codon:yes stop_codon:yes gene_type:complete